MYRPGEDFAVDEESPIEPTSPYARTKAMVEGILEDTATAGEIRAISLRYFNPIGADPQMRTGLQTRNPSHALGKMIVAWEAGESFTITGVDWPTRDGTGIRDYIHVWDLARAHVRAIEEFDNALAKVDSTFTYINIGGGDGVTVRELLAAVERVVGKPIPVTEAPARPGDAAGAFANADKAAELLGWKAELSLDEAIASALAWGEKRKDVLGYA
jgi:UDP-glucose 4-epimerase